MEFHGEVRVAARIIDFLSSGLYPNPAACIKELINNSYDADASKVEVFVKPDANRIIIVDNGTGFSRDEFERHFRNVSESHKRDESATTKRGRPKIGKIGIGFIAANEICDEMEILSTKRGSTDLLRVVIDFSEMRKPIEQRRRKGEIVKADYRGEILAASRDDHYTNLFLNQIRGPARDILASAKRQQLEGEPRSLYGLSPSSVSSALSDPKLKSWDEFDFYSQTMLKIGLNVPVPYLDDWMPSRGKKAVRTFAKQTHDLGFEVSYDGASLRKPIVFNDSRGYLVEPFKFRGDAVSAEGYFFARHGTVQPRELQGLLVRIRNSAVGEYDGSFWSFSQSEYSLIQRWASCEVWASDELEDAMNIDRATLRETHPAYVELRDAIHSKLRNFFSQVRVELYQTENAARRRADRREIVARLQHIADNVIERTSPEAAAEFRSVWADRGARPVDPLTKFTLPEALELFAHVAAEVLPKRYFDKLMSALHDQLRTRRG